MPTEVGIGRSMATDSGPTEPSAVVVWPRRVVPDDNPIEGSRSRENIVRRFVGELLQDEHGHPGPAVSDQEWESSWSAMVQSAGEEQAIAAAILRAYRMRVADPVHSRPAPSPPAWKHAAVAVPSIQNGGLPVSPQMVAVLAEAEPVLTTPTRSDDLTWPLGDGERLSPVAPQAPVGQPAPAGREALDWPLNGGSTPPPLDVAALAPASSSIPATSAFTAPTLLGQPPVAAVPTGVAPTVLRPGLPSRISRLYLRRRPTFLNTPPAGARAPRTATRLEHRRRERWLTIASWVRNLGAIILLFVGWQLWGTAITQHHDQSALQKQFVAKVHHTVTKPPRGFSLTPASTPTTDPPQGSVMAQLQIPAIGLNQYVVSGTDADDLAKGPGHYLGTAMPGQAGNVAIAGHRTTHGAPFNRLAQLAVGDPIYLTTLSGQRLTYIVSATPYPVQPTNVTVLNNFGDDRLTLTTCNPEYSARQRLIVVAAYQPPGATRAVPISKGPGTPYRLAPVATSGWDMKLVPLVLLEFGALILLGLAYRRLSSAYGRDGRWLILVPIWLGLLFALFETLTSFLPAAV
jgi:LPXTG-site transpeptidase (sortase) family protein